MQAMCDVVFRRKSRRHPPGYFPYSQRRTLALLIGFSVLVQSCATVSDRSAPMEELGGTSFSAGELRIRAQEFGYRFSAIIEETADRIIASSGDREVKLNALLWKMNGIPEIHRALSFEDPLVASMDLLVFSMQMHAFFHTGSGNNVFRDWQDLAVDATDKNESEAMLLLNEFSDPDIAAKMQKVTAEWVEENPVTDLRFSRASIVLLAAQTLGRTDLDLTSTVGALARGVSNIQRQITLYAEFMPKQARWQAEYLALTAINDSTRQVILSQLSRLDSAFIGVTKAVSGGPDLLRTLKNESFSEIDEQRNATLNSLRDERIAFMNALKKEREAMMSEIDRQRVATVADARVTVDAAMDRLASALVRAFDQILLRLVILGGVLFLLWAGANYVRGKKRGQIS